MTKPLDPDEIAHLVKNALAHKRTAQENVLLRETVAEVARPGELIGQSGAMRKIFDAIETVGPTEATVLVTGKAEPGRNWLRAPSIRPAREDFIPWSSFTAAR